MLLQREEISCCCCCYTKTNRQFHVRNENENAGVWTTMTTYGNREYVTLTNITFSIKFSLGPDLPPLIHPDSQLSRTRPAAPGNCPQCARHVAVLPSGATFQGHQHWSEPRAAGLPVCRAEASRAWRGASSLRLRSSGAGQLESQEGAFGSLWGPRFVAVLGETCGMNWSSGLTWRPSPL